MSSFLSVLVDSDWIKLTFTKSLPGVVCDHSLRGRTRRGRGGVRIKAASADKGANMHDIPRGRLNSYLRHIWLVIYRVLHQEGNQIFTVYTCFYSSSSDPEWSSSSSMAN
jgi:hypothetical protein